MNDEIEANAADQLRRCPAQFISGGLPLWAQHRCIKLTKAAIAKTSAAWRHRDRSAYQSSTKSLNRLLHQILKHRWNSLPPDLPRQQQESTDDWLNRMYAAWEGEEEYVGW